MHYHYHPFTEEKSNIPNPKSGQPNLYHDYHLRIGNLRKNTESNHPSWRLYILILLDHTILPYHSYYLHGGQQSQTHLIIYRRHNLFPGSLFPAY